MTRRRVHPAWKVLGIDPTSDTRAIRTAYSVKLKAIDPETDPKAFIALREALEAARIQAQWVDQADEGEEEELWDEEAGGENWVPAGDLYQIRPSGDVPTPPPPDPAWETPAPPEPADPAYETPSETPNSAWETPAPPEPPVSQEAPAPDADSYWQAFTPPKPSERPSPWAPISPEDADAHARSLASLLYSQDRDASPWPTPAQEEEMLAHWRAIIADPRMQELSYFADAERWFSELIARTSAFSDALVAPATEYFGWLKSDGSITQTPPIAWLTRRYRMLEFQQSVKQPRHPLHPAWRELVRPSGPDPTPWPRRGSVNGRKVRELLDIVRGRYPDLEGCFDPHRVALWDSARDNTGGGGGFSWSWVWPALFFGFLLLRFAMSAGGSSSTSYAPPPINQQFVVPDSNVRIPPPSVRIQPTPGPLSPSFPPAYTAPPQPLYLGGELEKADADLDQALEQLFGDTLDIATIAARDPRLYRALQGFWASEKAADVRKGKFTEDLRDFLDRRYPAGIREGNPRLFTR